MTLTSRDEMTCKFDGSAKLSYPRFSRSLTTERIIGPISSDPDLSNRRRRHVILRRVSNINCLKIRSQIIRSIRDDNLPCQRVADLLPEASFDIRAASAQNMQYRDFFLHQMSFVLMPDRFHIGSVLSLRWFARFWSCWPNWADQRHVACPQMHSCTLRG